MRKRGKKTTDKLRSLLEIDISNWSVWSRITQPEDSGPPQTELQLVPITNNETTQSTHVKQYSQSIIDQNS